MINKSVYSLNLSRWASNPVTLARLPQYQALHLGCFQASYA